MKFLLIISLVFAVSCSTKTEEKKEALPHTGAYAEQADVKPTKSPYTVKECYCMKIFKPVCAGGNNYGNSCEAECHGHTAWTEGHCGKK